MQGLAAAGLEHLVIFVLVLLQITEALRPILGTSDDLLPKEKKFFLSHWVESVSGPGNGASQR